MWLFKENILSEVEEFLEQDFISNAKLSKPAAHLRKPLIQLEATMDPKTFISVLYLLLYSSFSTADLSFDDTVKVDKALSPGKELVTLMDNVAESTNARNAGKIVQNTLAAFRGLGKIASDLGFAGEGLINLAFSVMAQNDPKHEFIKQQFAEVKRKLKSLSLQMSSLQEQLDWTDYASVYGRDESNIKNSHSKLKDFMAKAPLAKTKQRKMRLAERFTTYYENAGTEDSVSNFHRYITDRNPVSLNKNLLKLVTDKSNGNFDILAQYSSYFTSLVVSGLQMNLHYYILKGFNVTEKTKQTVTEIYEIQSAIEDSLIECADDFETWAKKDVEEIATKSFSDNKELEYRIKKHLHKKFTWYHWTVIVHDSKEEIAINPGNSVIDLIVQDKAIIHLIHREKGFHVDKGIKRQMVNEWASQGESCSKKTYHFNNIIVKHVEFIHELSDDNQTDSGDVKLTCESCLPSLLACTNKTVSIYLKSANIEKPLCSACYNGQCKQIKDTTQGFCKCHEMFRGPTCEINIQNDIDYAAIEEHLNAVGFQAVPDLTAIYFSIKDMKEYMGAQFNSLRHDIHWTQKLVKYNDAIENFQYLVSSHVSLEDGTMPQHKYVSEVGTHFTQRDTFLRMLFTFDQMMQGTGFVDQSNILDVFRNSLLDKENQPDDPFVCSKSYVSGVNNFISYMFALEKESILAWMKYLLITHKSNDTVNVNNVEHSKMYFKNLFHNYVTQQWKRFNQNGCGSLNAEGLSNAYCEKPYHSTDQQKIKLKCKYNDKPYPNSVQCSNGSWDVLPVCYTDPIRGYASCNSESGATVCRATCQSGWAFTDGRSSESYQCTKQPCQSFNPKNCVRCTSHGVCRDHEVCRNGECVDGCSASPCGVNTRCSTRDHRRSCTCVSPWVRYTEDDLSLGCRYKQPEWTAWAYDKNPPWNVVKTRTGIPVCRARASNGQWYGGWLWQKPWKTWRCYYQYAASQQEDYIFQVLLNPCGTGGTSWDYVEGSSSRKSIASYPSSGWWLCSSVKDGYPGEVADNSCGRGCHIGWGSCYVTSNYYTLTHKPCI